MMTEHMYHNSKASILAEINNAVRTIANIELTVDEISTLVKYISTENEYCIEVTQNADKMAEFLTLKEQRQKLFCYEEEFIYEEGIKVINDNLEFGRSRRRYYKDNGNEICNEEKRHANFNMNKTHAVIIERHTGKISKGELSETIFCKIVIYIPKNNTCTEVDDIKKLSSAIIKNSKPIEITKDGTVIEKIRIYNPDGFAVTIKANHVVIRECEISGAINIYGNVHDIVIQNNYIHDVIPQGDFNFVKQFAGITTTEGERWGNPLVQPMGASNISIQGNYFENCPTGTYLVECRGPILFKGNYSRNHRGPFPRGQMVQLTCCDGIEAPIIIENNFSYINPCSPDQNNRELTGLGAEDHINIYATLGSEKYPVMVRNNYIYGYSSSCFGSGIMAGDGGGSYYTIENNQVYNTGNAGIGMSGGHHIRVAGNRICQMLPASQYNGKGLQVDNYGDAFTKSVEIERNLVYWTCGRGDGSILCMIPEIVEFKDNIIGDTCILGKIGDMPKHCPSEPVEGLIKPWE